MATLFQLPSVSPVIAGESLPGGRLYFFLSGTTTPITTYTTSALSVAHNHPVEADANGVFPPVYINEEVNATYRIQLKTAADALVPNGDQDNLLALPNLNKIVSHVSSVGGSGNAITLTPSLPIDAYEAGQCFRFVAGSANTGAVTVAVSGLTTKAITKNGSNALVSGDIPAGAVVWITYDGTQFQLSETVAYSGTYTGTLTGLTTSPTITVRYAVSGNLVTLQVPAGTGTSNATSFTVTGAPANIRPTGSIAGGYSNVYQITNNGSAEYGTGGVAMTNTGILTFYRSGSATGFTNSGTKAFAEFVMSYIRNAG